jgi:hypothetical protein
MDIFLLRTSLSRLFIEKKKKYYYSKALPHYLPGDAEENREIHVIIAGLWIEGRSWYLLITKQ